MEVNQVKIDDETTIFVVKNEKMRLLIENAIKPSLQEQIKFFIKDGSFEEELFDFDDDELTKTRVFKSEKIFLFAVNYMKIIKKSEQNEQTTIIYNAIGYTYFKGRNNNAANRYFNKVLSIYHNTESWYWCGRNKFEQLLVDNAIKELSNKLVKNDKRAKYWLAKCYIRKKVKEYEKAIECLHELKFENPDYMYDIKLMLSECYNHNLSYKAMYLKEALEIKETYSVRENIAKIYEKLGEYKNAIDNYVKLFNEKKSKDTAIKIAMLERILDNSDEALAWLKTATCY